MYLYLVFWCIHILSILVKYAQPEFSPDNTFLFGRKTPIDKLAERANNVTICSISVGAVDICGAGWPRGVDGASGGLHRRVTEVGRWQQCADPTLI